MSKGRRRRTAKKTPHQVLGVDPGASQQEIQEAYLLLVATYGDGSFAAYPLLSKEQRHEILREVERAFQSLRQSSRRPLVAAAEPAQPPRAEAPQLPELQAWKWLSSWLSMARVNPTETPPLTEESPAALRKRVARQRRLPAGQYLKSVRTHRGLSLSAIADLTKIGVEHLKALEEGKYDELPSGAYPRMMLRAYARSLDLSPEFLLKDLPDSGD